MRVAGLTSVPITTTFSERFGLDAARLDQRRETLRGINGGYSRAQVKVKVTGIDVEGERVTLQVIEHTKLFYPSGPADAPEAEEYALRRDLVFLRGPGGWLLDDTTVAEPNDALLPVTEHWDDAAPTSATPPPDRLPSSTERETAINDQLVEASSPDDIVTLASYSYPAMTAYALAHWSSYNSSYRAYQNDCTNFISQITSAGGWSYVGGGPFDDRTDKSKWYYGSFTWTTSYTWAGAENWYWFATGSGRTLILPSVWNMQETDVLQADWDKNNSIDHTMFVTKTDAAGEKYLTYHTTDTLNKKLSTLLSQYSAWWYAHST
jgi:hypothetical protein